MDLGKSLRACITKTLDRDEELRRVSTCVPHQAGVQVCPMKMEDHGATRAEMLQTEQLMGD